MAHTAIPLSSVQLVDNWPGPVNPNKGKPIGGWDGTHDSFVTAVDSTVPTQPIGEKRMAYTDNSHCPGWFTMMFLQYHSFENACISKDVSDSLQMCTHYEGSDCESYDNSHAQYYTVTNEITIGNTDYSKGARVAFPCGTMDSDGTLAGPDNNSYGDQWGWFWVGGVCPCKDATILDTTDGSGLGVDFECASTYEGGPLALDVSSDGTTGYLFFKEHIYGPFTPNIYGVQQSRIVGFGDLSGS